MYNIVRSSSSSRTHIYVKGPLHNVSLMRYSDVIWLQSHIAYRSYPEPLQVPHSPPLIHWLRPIDQRSLIGSVSHPTLSPPLFWLIAIFWLDLGRWLARSDGYCAFLCLCLWYLVFSLFFLVFYLPIMLFLHCEGSWHAFCFIFEWPLSKFWRLQ